MAVSKKIINYLDKNGYKYETINHKMTYTAWDTSQTEHIKPQEVAKTLVMKADGYYFLALISANRKLDKRKLLKIVKASDKKNGRKESKKIDLADEKWMKKNIQGKVGAVPPFWGVTKLNVFFDGLLAKNKKIYVGSGEYTASFKISVSQFLKIEQAVKGNFSVKK